LGFSILATGGTADALETGGVPVQRVKKLIEGTPNLLDYFAKREVALVMNTPSGKRARTDGGRIRAAAVAAGVPCVTTLEAATAAVKAIEALREEDMQVQSLQERFAQL
jgi:carbamoyl-phosphate synthase large subunit